MYDGAVVFISYILSYLLRYNSLTLEVLDINNILKASIVILPVNLLCFYSMGLYRGIWRFSSIPDLVRIIKGISLGVTMSFLVLFLFTRLESIPRSIFLIHWTLLLIGIGGGRFAYRVYQDVNLGREVTNKKRKRLTIILGAGYSAQLLIREIISNPASDIRIIGLLDDDISKRNKILHGFKVLGSISDIGQIAKLHGVNDVIIAIPKATKEQLNNIISYCDSTQLKVKMIPSISDLISGKVQITKLRKVTPTDLLGRDQVKLDIASVSHMISDKIVLVTGGGGSIGSELCLQIAKLKPRKLICFDISELNLYELGFKLEKFHEFTELEYIIGDVRDAKKISDVFNTYCPNIVFHAAAYKHVPMMELNPFEAIKVNVIGTQSLAEVSHEYKVDKFVLISTDKAVNPTNVMGTTKRIAEMICQNIQKRSQTKFEVVRFGNVLGSSGSVIPRFQKQIENGGPLTVTHPEILRYFMSIPEAAQLVIQAGAIGNGGEIFILDMGQPVKIADLAKQMITLAGLKLDEDIEIEYTGLRTGEKLYEELLADTESTLPTAHDRVRVAKVREVDNTLEEKISNLFDSSDESCIREKLKNIVPEYEIPESLRGKKTLSYSSVNLN